MLKKCYADSTSKRWTINMYSDMLRYLIKNVGEKSKNSDCTINNRIIKTIENRRSDLCISINKNRSI